MKHQKDGEPCSHPGCLNHRSHPCEGCGRIGGRKGLWLEEVDRNLLDIPMKVALGDIYDALHVNGKYYRLPAKEEK